MQTPLLSLDQPVALSLACTLVSVLPCRIAAGFPSPAEDHAVQRIDLMAQLIKHPQATFLLRVRGESMKDAGIFDNDVVLVDRAITARTGHVVIAVSGCIKVRNSGGVCPGGRAKAKGPIGPFANFEINASL